MCLETVYKGKKKTRALNKLPDMVTCWKIVAKWHNQYGSRYSPEYNYKNQSFLSGWNKTEPLIERWFPYPIAFHAFRTKAAAKDWSIGIGYLHIVKCKTRKRDIVALGEQRNHLCIVTKRIWIPKPRAKTA